MTCGEDGTRTHDIYLAKVAFQPTELQPQITLSSYNLHSHRVILSGSTSLLGRNILAVWMHGLFGPSPLTIPQCQNCCQYYLLQPVRLRLDYVIGMGFEPMILRMKISRPRPTRRTDDRRYFKQYCWNRTNDTRINNLML